MKLLSTTLLLSLLLTSAPTCLGVTPNPAPPARAQQPILTDEPVSPDERTKLAGTYVLKVVEGGYHDSFAQYRRTYRVFDENGRLMIEALGETPERLLKQKNGSFAIRSWPQAPVTFVMHDQNALTLHLTNSGLTLAGERVGPADPETFHFYGTSTPKASSAAMATAHE